MRNSILFILSLACISIIACKKNSITKQQETPLQTLVSTKFLDSIKIGDYPARESGYSFSSSKNGKITKLGCYMPDTLSYTVALWDSANQSLLQAISVKVTDPTKFNYADIAPIAITANKTYAITINNTVAGKAQKCFTLSKKSKLSLPIISGTINIKEEAWREGCSETCFPQDFFVSTTTLSGIPDFVFEPEN